MGSGGPSAGPTRTSVVRRLGSARDAWDAIVAAVEEAHGPLASMWKPSKAGFGWWCALKKGKRTVVYLTPEDGAVRVAVVLGERAVARALDSALPEAIKTLIREARPYVEGRGIRFEVRTPAEVGVVTELVAIKMS